MCYFYNICFLDELDTSDYFWENDILYYFVPSTTKQYCFQSFQFEDDDTSSEYSNSLGNAKEDDKRKRRRKGEDSERLMRKEQW